MSSATPVITVRALEKSFGDGQARRSVLHHIDLDVVDGELMMLVGPSGCGKTTLISLIAGTLKPDSGTIDVFGSPLHAMSARALTSFRSQNIGFIFQQFHLIPTLTLAENASVPLIIQGMRSGPAEKKARYWLERVGLGDRWKDRPSQLSGGQQQRVAIARALVHEPPLVICDEPTAALDSHNGEIVLELFRNVARSPDRAVIIVTHDNRIFSYADRIARMDDGEIIEERRQHHEEAPHFIHEHAL